jgi:hypothetical protein
MLDLMARTREIPVDAPCLALHAFLNISVLGLSVQPRPILGKIDLAGVFFHRDALALEGLYFSELMPDGRGGHMTNLAVF